MQYKPLTAASLILAATGLLTACGGGEDTGLIGSTTQKASPLNAPDSETNSTQLNGAQEGSEMHSSDAHIFTGESARKSSELPVEIVKSVPVSALGRAQQVQIIDLGTLPTSELVKRDRNNRSDATLAGRKAYQTGIGRTISATGEAKAFQQVLTWSTLSDGKQTGAAQFSSPGAYGLRLGILITSLPDAATVRVASVGASTALEISGAAINSAIQANVAADGDSANARTYWLPMTTGSSAELTIELPGAVSPASVAIAVPSLSHVIESTSQASEKLAATKSNCPGLNPDPVCTTVPPAANAVSTYDLVQNANTYYCTGTLLADKALSNQPYFLTANHCVGSQTVASTLVNYWFYRSSSCNSNTPSTPVQSTAGGAAFLWNRSDTTTNTRNPIGTDTSFLRLNAAPPSGVMFAGWKTSRQPISNSVPLTALHHPAGGVLRQSTGTISNMGVLTPNTLISTGDLTQPMYQITWSSGLVEGGSSGSGLFYNGTTANPQLIGQLWG
jgi:lysyl endopeptidase